MMVVVENEQKPDVAKYFFCLYIVQDVETMCMRTCRHVCYASVYMCMFVCCACVRVSVCICVFVH